MPTICLKKVVPTLAQFVELLFGCFMIAFG
jgi:hypothetical protein